MKIREAQYKPGLVVFSLGIILTTIFKLEDLSNVYFGVFVGIIYCEFMYQWCFRRSDKRGKSNEN